MPGSRHHCEICGEDAPVGVGVPVRWVCMDHFNAYLKAVAEVVDRLREEHHDQVQAPTR